MVKKSKNEVTMQMIPVLVVIQTTTVNITTSLPVIMRRIKKGKSRRSTRRNRSMITSLIMFYFVVNALHLSTAFLIFRSTSQTHCNRRHSFSTRITTKPTMKRTKKSASSLFGIKGFRSWFQDQFPNAVRNVDVDRHNDSFDHVLIDMNQILHVVLRRSRSHEQATKFLMYELDTLIERCCPVQSLVLAIDGAPAAAKLATQRKRRLAILKNTQFKMDNSEKLRMSKRMRAKRMRNYKAELRSLELTPGTSLLRTMEEAVLYWAWQRLSSRKSNSKLSPKVRIYISPSSVPGEGEIKLLEWINNFRRHLSKNPGQSIALIGGDADLILESMVIPISWTHNIFVLRPEEPEQSRKKIRKRRTSRIRQRQVSIENLSQPPQNRSRSSSSDKSDAGKGSSNSNSNKIMHCTSIWEMTLSLDDYCRQNIPKKYYDPDNNPENLKLLLQIRTDMVILLMLNGNDYLPRVVAVGFRGVLRTYLALLKKWIVDVQKSNIDVGLVDPNTLKFRSLFCTEFFRILGRNAPSEEERLRNIKRSKRKTYHSILNDMSSIGFIPSPVCFRLVDDANIENGESTYQILEQLDDNDDEELDEEEVEAEEDLDDDYDERQENDEYDDEEEYIDDLNCIDDTKTTMKNISFFKNDKLDDDVDDDDDDDDKMDVMQLSLGLKDSDDYHEYRIRFNPTSTKSRSKVKKRLARMALKEFSILEYIDTHGDISKNLYEWEIPYPAAANVDRYLGGLLWTLQTYQDGVCPSYGYNYGKCLAPTGCSIAAYFEQAILKKMDVGLEDLLPNMKSGDSIKAGVACLAALPVSVKDLVPKPYSLIEDETVENIYAQCIDPVDNYFNFKEFEKLVDVELTKIIASDDGGDEDNLKSNTTATTTDQGRRIVLGDHYWTVIKRSKDAIQHPFCPPSPPTENFSQLRPNSRIVANRIISMARPYRRRASMNGQQQQKQRNSKEPRRYRTVWENNDVDVDHLNFLSLIKNKSESKNTVLDIPYKTAFSSSPEIYGGSRQYKEKKSFKLLSSRPIAFHSFNHIEDGTDSNENTEIMDIKELPTPMFNPQNQSALAVLKQLGDIHLVNNYDFNEYKNQNITLTITMDEIDDNLPSNTLSFSWIRGISQPEQAVKQYLSSLALDVIIRSENPCRWYDFTFQDLKNHLELRNFSRVTTISNLEVNPENRTAIEIIKELCDIGTIRSYEFNEIPASSNQPEKITLLVHKISLDVSSEDTFSFERVRTTQKKKLIRQQLMSLALDEIISVNSKNVTKTHWCHLSFDLINTRIKGSISTP